MLHLLMPVLHPGSNQKSQETFVLMEYVFLFTPGGQGRVHSKRTSRLMRAR